jgi:hypothetical protein
VVNNVKVTWGVKWPGPVDYSTLSPTVTIERSVGDEESYEEAVAEAHGLAFQSALEALLDGIRRMEREMNAEGKKLQR